MAWVRAARLSCRAIAGEFVPSLAALVPRTRLRDLRCGDGLGCPSPHRKYPRRQTWGRRCGGRVATAFKKRYRRGLDDDLPLVSSYATLVLRAERRPQRARRALAATRRLKHARPALATARKIATCRATRHPRCDGLLMVAHWPIDGQQNSHRQDSAVDVTRSSRSSRSQPSLQRRYARRREHVNDSNRQCWRRRLHREGR